MRILAIRGKNLASLAGEFSLDLERAPLGAAGLFAITGPTGAGKSTLLDALCLALFDRTPRLDGTRGVPVGRPDEPDEQRLATHDVRTLLQRGAGAGHAEVEFTGRDRRRYRARWSVRRARERSDGRMQPQELLLEDMANGNILGRTKAETLAAVEERLGLSYGQFLRSALLAQNDFAAFLRADARERAELLERMTGTELYGWLSAGAFERARAEQHRLAELEQQRDARPRLDAEQRRSLELELERLQEQAQVALAIEEAALHSVAWHEAALRLASDEEVALAALAEAEAALAELRPVEEELRAMAAVEPLRPLHARRIERDQQARQAREDQARLGSEAQAATALELERSVELERAVARRASAVAALEEAAPALERALRLDADLASARVRATDAAERATVAARALADARKRADRRARDVATLEGKRSEADAWLMAHREVEPLADGWSRWQQDLQRVAEATRRGASASSKLVALGAQRDTARAALEGADRAAGEARARRERAEQALREAEAAVDKEGHLALRTERERLTLERFALDRQRALLVEARTVRAERDEERQREALAMARAAEAHGRALALVDEARSTVAALGEAERALADARASRELAAHRARLHAGEPCPLCGALEHPRPLDGDSAIVAALSARLEARVAELGAARSDGERRLAQARVDEETAGGRAEDARARAHRKQRSLEELAERWAAAWPEGAAPRLPGMAVARVEADSAHDDPPPADPSPADPSPAEAARDDDPLVERSAALARAQAALDAAETEQQRRAHALAVARSACDEARAGEEGARRAHAGVQAALAAIDREMATLTDEERGAEAERNRCLRELMPAFAHRPLVLASLSQDPEGFAGSCAAEVAAYQQHRRARTASDGKLAEVRRDAEGQTASERASDGESKRRDAERSDAEAALVRLASARAALLGGRPAHALRAELQSSLDEAERSLERARSAASEAGRTAAAARSRADDADRRALAAVAACTEAEAAFVAALAAHGLDGARAEVLLARPPAWAADRRNELDARRQRRDAARTVREERAARRARHEAERSATGQVLLDAPSARAALEDARAERMALEEARAQALGRYSSDEDSRAHAEAIGPRVDTQRAVYERWQGLSNLIGSADGKKFRVFAQSLTLDALLVHANQHLLELARRYRLQRVPGHDLDLMVVDAEMGDEVRGTTSLSGGETFLVSLALALGLSSLSSRETQVETLFIDEGFGSLDPATLEQALAALDALQASGRQVGLISHLPGLVDRIGVAVRVTPIGGGKSKVSVES